jgi:hypothetical protein
MKLRKEDIIGLPEEASKTVKSSATYASFGDKGTTASINSYGAIMQMTQFLGAGTSGFFSVDQIGVEEPYHVMQRAQTLVDKCEYADGLTWGTYTDEGPRKMIQIAESKTPWAMAFVQDRWLRLTSEYFENFRIIVNNFVSNGIAFQEIIHETTEGSDSVIIRERKMDNRSIRLPDKRFGLYQP